PDNDSLTEGDLWFEVIEGEYVKTWRYDGESWQIILDMGDKEIEEIANEANERAEEAHERATDSLKNSEEAVNKAQEGFDMAQENASEIDSFGVRIDDAEGNITKISGTVDGLQTTVKDNEDNIYTLTQTAEGLESRVGEVENWEIGARNLITKTDFSDMDNIDNLPGSDGLSYKRQREVNGHYVMYDWISSSNVETGQHIRVFFRNDHLHLKKGEEYTLSFIGRDYYIREGGGDWNYTWLFNRDGADQRITNIERGDKVGSSDTGIAIYEYKTTFTYNLEDEDDVYL